MKNQPGGSRGRPPAASRDMLQDAAFELFLENGYAGTTVEQIAQRAGVSRNTFFNYFDAKGDVFWVELDETFPRFSDALATEQSTDARPLLRVRDAVIAVASYFGPGRVPFALTQHELIGSAHELQASALGRFTTQARVIRDYLTGHGWDPLRAQAVAYALIGAVVAAAQSWAAAGTTRGNLEPYLHTAIDPIIDGFAPGSKGPTAPISNA